MKLKRFGCLAATIFAVGLVGLACFGFMQFQRSVEMGFASPYRFVSTGAREEYQAHFVTSGFQDRGISLFVLSATESEGNPKLVANLNWCGDSFDSAVWSQDESVIACRSHVYTEEDNAESAQKKLNNDYSFTPTPDYVPYSCAFDFRHGKPAVYRRDGYGSRAEWQTHSKAIDELLKSRGGVGREVTKQVIDKQSRRLNWTEWQPYQQALRRGPS